MSGLSRPLITRGSGCVWWSPSASPVALPSKEGGISCVIEPKEVQVASDPDGPIDPRLSDVEGKLSWTPLGLLTNDVLGVLYPVAYRNPVRGASLFGSADKPVLVHSTAGTKVTLMSCAVTKMPDLILSGAKEIFGACEVTAIRRNAAEWTEEDALYKLETAAYAAPQVPSSNVVMTKYAAAWGDLLPAIWTEDGWTCNFDLQSKPDSVDGYGTNDHLLDTVGAIARCKPKNLSETLLDKLYIQGAGAGIGVSRRRGANLVITGGSLTVTLYDARLQRGPLKWRGVEVRADELAFVASRAEADGAYGAVFAINLA